MPADWSLILNILLLAGVIVAIGRLMKNRRDSFNYERSKLAGGRVDNSPYDKQPLHDDIIAVRKIDAEMTTEDLPACSTVPRTAKKTKPFLVSQEEILDDIKPKKKTYQATAPSIMLFLLAKETRQFAGYDLLQTLLACGLRFGEGQLFHRHEEANGEGEIVCSLAAATASGVFDLQNIGAFQVKGLCLFMHATTDSAVNAKRFSLMLETAKQLSESLDAHLLDENRKPLGDERIAYYHRILNIEENDLECIAI